MKTLIDFGSKVKSIICKVFSFVSLMLLCSSFISGQTTITSTSTGGNWSSGTSWVGGIAPTLSNNVTIVNGATITLDNNFGCINLTLLGTTGTRLVIGNYILTVTGTLNGPSTSFTNNIISTGSGELEFTGNSRALFGINWSGNHTNAWPWRCDVALTNGQIGTASTHVKMGYLIVTSGTFQVGTSVAARDLRIDVTGIDGSGTVSIASGAYLTVTGIMGARLASTQTSYCGTVDINGTLTIQGQRLNGTININSNGVLVIKRLTNTNILVSNPVNNFTYSSGSLLQYDLEPGVGKIDTGAEISQAQSSSLSNLTLNNPNSINLKSSLTVNGILRIISGNISADVGMSIAYGSSGELYFQGTSAQTTSTLTFPTSSGPYNFTIDNPSGVSLNGDRTINGTVTVKTDAVFNAQGFTIGGTGRFDIQSNATLITAHAYGLDGTNTTSGTSTYDNAANYVFNAYATQQVTGTNFPTIVNNLTVDNYALLELSNSSLSVNGTLLVNAGTTLDAKGVAIDGGGNFYVDDYSTFITAHPNGLDGTNATTGGISYFGVSNYTFNYPGAQVTGNWLPPSINNLLVDNSSILALSNSLDCNDVTAVGTTQLIVPPGIGLTSNGVATFGDHNPGTGNPLLLKTSTTSYRSIMGTFINNPANGVMGLISSEFRYTSRGGDISKLGGRSYYFSPSTYEATSGLFNPEITANDGNNPFSHFQFSNRAWSRINNGTTALLGMNAYGIRAATSQTFTVTGFPNDQASYSVSLPCPTPSNNWWYMVGNPYPAVIDWDLITLPPEIDVTMYYRTSTTSGSMCTDSYQQYSGVGTANNGTNVDGKIPPMQAFWVRATGTSGSATLTITSNARGHLWGGTNAFYKSKAKTKATPTKDIFSLFMYTNSLRDQLIIVQADYADDAYDKWDSFKRFEDDTSRAALYSFTPELYKAVIQSVKPITGEKIFPIGLFNTFPTKSFRFEADFSKASSKYNYFIEDTKLGITQDLKQNPNYTFIAESIKDSIGTRFKLHVLLAPKVLVNTSVSSCSSQTVDLTASSITQGSDNGLIYTYWLNPEATVPYTTPAIAEAGTYYIKGTAANGSYSISAPIVLTNKPPTVVATSPTAVCSPMTVDLTSPEITSGSTEGLTYTYWTDSNATLSYNSPTYATDGSYHLKGTDPYGCSTISNPVQVTVNQSPSVTITSPKAVCAPMTVDLTSPEIISGSTEGLSYSFWSNTNATLAYNNPSAATSGNYYIKGTASNGCYAISGPIQVTVNSAPTLFIANPNAVCSPMTVDLTSPEIALGSTDGLTFSYWTDENASLSLSTPTSVTNGIYYIKGTTIQGCFTITGIIVTVNPSPTVITTNPTPVADPATVDLTAPEITVGSTEGLTYSYWLDNLATQPYSTPQFATAGNYYIMGTVDPTGCFAIAGPVEVVITTGIPVDLGRGTHIYSYDKQIYVDNCVPNSTITIFDLLGRQIYSRVLRSDHEIIPVNTNSGLYIVRIVNETMVKSQKVYLQ